MSERKANAVADTRGVADDVGTWVTVAVVDGTVSTMSAIDRRSNGDVLVLAAALRAAADDLERCSPGCVAAQECGLAVECVETLAPGFVGAESVSRGSSNVAVRGFRG